MWPTFQGISLHLFRGLTRLTTASEREEHIYTQALY